MRKNAAQHGEVKNIVGRLLADKADIFAVILGQQQTHRALQQGVMMRRRKARESFDLVEDVFVFVSDFVVVLVQRRAQTGQQEIHKCPSPRQAISGCASNISCSHVVPDLSAPQTKNSGLESPPRHPRATPSIPPAAEHCRHIREAYSTRRYSLSQPLSRPLVIQFGTRLIPRSGDNDS